MRFLIKTPWRHVAGATPSGIPSAWSRRTVLTGRLPFQPLANLSAVLSIAGTIWTVAIMFLITADLLGRSIFNSPLPRVPEIVGYSIVAIVFLQVADSIRHGRLARSDAFLDGIEMRTPAAAGLFFFVFHLVGAAIMALIAYGTLPDLQEAWIYDDYFGSQGDFAVAVWPFRAIVVICATIAAAEFLVQAWLSLRAVMKDEPEHPDAHRGAPKGYTAIAIFALIGACSAALLLSASDGFAIAAILVVLMVLIVLIGMPIATALAALSFVGVWLLRGDLESAINMLKIAATGSIQNQLFGVVPLFVLMGMLVHEARVGRDAFDVCQWLLGRLLGGLGVATVAANTVFAAITGISIASAVVFTRVAVPPMLEHGYSARFAVGVVAGSSVLGMLIPPSLLLIVYGIIAEVSVGALFTAAIVPGLILATGFCFMIYGLARWVPSFVGNLDRIISTDFPSAWSRTPAQTETPRSALLKLTPIAFLVVSVLGGIYGGFFTPTEAGAVGAVLALIVYAIKAALLPGMSSWGALWRVMIETGQISVSILLLIIAANMYTRMIALSGLPADLVGLATSADLQLMTLIVVYLIALLLMGMVLDSVSIMLITLPLMLPLLVSFNVDLIWFGIVTVIAIEVGLLTPPLGLSVYVVKAALGNTQVTLRDIFIGTSPFVAAMLFMIALLLLFPQMTSVLR
ncbi:TRAP transporter large permease subunit [Pseudahrensia aquimaris]|uniref:TRAP transporter large permease subunit n=1 Tax=Pseudahrensia aquimaris TaxID=744461 RepID=A0ABW3FBZ4_9HYPH